MSIYLTGFIVIFLLNLIPVFGPPTWSVLSFMSFYYTIPSLPLFIFISLCASTLGRIILTLTSKHILRNRILGIKYRKNMDYLKRHLEKRPHFASAVFFIEAFTPLPSDQLFVAYGLTGMKLRYALVPFFIARIFTYSFFVYMAKRFSDATILHSITPHSFISWPVIVAEVLVLILIYFFVKVDWAHFIMRNKLKIIH